MRKPTAGVVPIMATLPLEEVTEGAVTLVLEARSRENELLAQATKPMQRSKKESIDVLSAMDDQDISLTWVGQFQDKLQLYEHVMSLRPIAGDQERTIMENTFVTPDKPELEHLQRFMYAFWESREPLDPQSAWLIYKEKVDLVEREFGTMNKKGYETDRGRVFLEYGPPNDITDRANEPSSYPYQIWRYYKAKQFNNARFVFYDPTLMAEDYELLHAEGVRGEINNPQWRLLLEQRNTPMHNSDREQGIQHMGGRVDDYFENPR
jgi:GWxTD domain-containing protein